jgi:anti-anti-sigma factor
LGFETWDNKMGLSDFKPRYLKLAEHDDVVVAMVGITQINDEENIEELGHELFAVVDQYGFRKVVLDLTGVQYITSSVVGKMITMHRKLHRINGQLVICNLTKGVEGVLSASRMLSYFAHAATTQEAIDLLKSEDTVDTNVAELDL